MESNNYEIVPLFPIPLYTTELPTSLIPILKHIDTQEIVDSGDVKNYGGRSKNTYILNTPHYSDLSNFVLKSTLEYGQKVLNYSYNEYKFTQSWISHKRPGESHLSHTHSNSLISGVIYYGRWDDSLPNIVFNNELLLQHPIRPKYNPTPNKDYEIYASHHLEYITSPGTMILFPSTLAHGVPKNTSNYIRKSLAFNLVPTEGFGDESELTHLKIN